MSVKRKGKTLSDLAKGNLLHFPFANKMNIQIELSETCVEKSQKTCWIENTYFINNIDIFPLNRFQLDFYEIVPLFFIFCWKLFKSVLNWI